MSEDTVYDYLIRSRDDFVEVGHLSPETRRAWDIEGYYMTGEAAAWLFFRLRQIPDSEERFPRGKWASIQHLEQLIDEQASKFEPELPPDEGEG